ncbi:16S rRNA (guanine(966)-N(2))-methyltransferase RsmD [Litoreibacter arenae]|uniref:16S rRNA (Guanine(966)-N(2))-methyltransferase n=1 Tax=Litoreibacter arenae DSM 19593 TaxID=1123360 RepID=S9RTY7_9RHOB|nr:16S rRNA (guanine(966)-N(2))-methyltransferase RsmD [Litoreibacter arenae]EPX77424.1 16S rRNA (guanine(966)-N(2))-methyltransferase [Litoreibacter arenae DSM 19593]
MRIIGGTHRSVALTPVGKGDEAGHLRPTTDRIRESLFNVLAGGRFGDPLTDARVLDLFAGTGALGLEALSRGAAQVCFIEKGRAGYKILSKNIAKLRAGEVTNALTWDATRLPANPYKPFDLVFLDPPYGKALGPAALICTKAQGWIADDALIVWEEESPQTAPEGFAVLEAKKYGSTHITFLEPA